MTTQTLRHDPLRPMARIEIRTLSRPAAVDVRHALGQLAGVLALFSLGVLGVAVRVLVYTPM